MTISYLSNDRSVICSKSFSSFLIYFRYTDDGDVELVVIGLPVNRVYCFNIDNVLKIQHDYFSLFFSF